MQAAGNTGGKSWIPSIAMAVNCCLWLVYGYISDDMAIFIVNAYGMMAGTYYVYVFWYLLAAHETKVPLPS